MKKVVKYLMKILSLNICGDTFHPEWNDMECLKRLANRGGHFQCFFYRTASGLEVDLICEYRGKSSAYEIKFAKTLSKEMAKSLTLFSKDHNLNLLRVLSLNENDFSLTREVIAIHWSTILTDLF